MFWFFYWLDTFEYNLSFRALLNGIFEWNLFEWLSLWCLFLFLTLVKIVLLKIHFKLSDSLTNDIFLLLANFYLWSLLIYFYVSLDPWHLFWRWLHWRYLQRSQLNRRFNRYQKCFLRTLKLSILTHLNCTIVHHWLLWRLSLNSHNLTCWFMLHWLYGYFWWVWLSFLDAWLNKSKALIDYLLWTVWIVCAFKQDQSLLFTSESIMQSLCMWIIYHWVLLACHQ